MPSVIDPHIPLVVISNFAEAHVDFLGRSEDPAERDDLIFGEAYHADRTLLWLGDHKLVIVSYPIAHAEYIYRRVGYSCTDYAAPIAPTPFLCLDILREPGLLNRLVQYAGPGRSIQMVPYATTPEFLQLADTLRREFGLTVLLPESPSPECLWLRDYIDTKAGFNLLASFWLPDSSKVLPAGIVCQSFLQAAKAAYWFSCQGKTCIIKADTGESGIGFTIIKPGDFAGPEEILPVLENNAYLDAELVLVQEFIPSSGLISPSLELFVPALGQGEPEITYVSNQLFVEFGDFCGVVVSRDLLEAAWYPTLARSGLTIAKKLQEMGYVGHFDLDTVVDYHDRVFLLEVNSRRTGGTHVHEFARYAFGPDYLDKVVVLSRESMSSHTITDPQELLSALDDVLYPMQDGPYGAVITITSALSANRFGCIIAARSTQHALEIQRAMAERIESWRPELSKPLKAF